MKKEGSWKIILFLIFLVGGWFRFNNLGWGGGFFFHPDENNIAISVSQLKPPDFHPHFFAYGHLPGYLVYFTNQLVAGLKRGSFGEGVDFDQVVWGLRFFSAMEGIFLIPLVFLIGRRIFKTREGLIAAGLVALTPGLIQAAHFGTTESLLTLILFLTLFLSLRLLEKKTPWSIFVWLGVVLGIGLSTKINALVFFSFPLLAIFLREGINWEKLKKELGWLLVAFGLAILVMVLTSPWQILDFEEFKRIVSYEIEVAQGKLLVFYTRQFANTKPIVFQLNKIFPFALNPLLEITGLAGLGLMLWGLRKKRFSKEKLLLVAAFGLYLLPNSLTFAKWTRFVTPLLPFFALGTGELIIFLEKRAFKRARNLLIGGLILVGFLAAMSFGAIYSQKDVRARASEWMVSNLPARSKIISEGGNVVNLPLGGNFQVWNADFYNLEKDSMIFEKLLWGLEGADYILVPSRRIFANHPFEDYPKTACYYQLLFSGKLGFEKQREFRSYPTVGLGMRKWEFPDETAEETWSVFDHPVIRLYKREKFSSKEEYRQLFESCLNRENG